MQERGLPYFKNSYGQIVTEEKYERFCNREAGDGQSLLESRERLVVRI